MDLKLIKPYIGKPKGYVFENFDYSTGSRLIGKGIGEWVDNSKKDTAKPKVEKPKAEADDKPRKAKTRKKA